MFEVLKKLIESNTRTLRDLEGRIAYCVANGGIMPEEAEELTTLAAAQATPPDVPESTEMAVRLGTLEAAVTALAGRVATLETKPDTEPTDGEEPAETPAGPPDGVEQWSPAKAYMYGAVVWDKGQIWVSQEGNNRFEPGVAAWAWKVTG